MIFTMPPMPPAQPTAPAVTIWIHGTQPSVFTKTTGLYKADELDAASYTRLFMQALAETAPQQFPFEHCYAFKWSGKASLKERITAGNNLCNALVDVQQQYIQKYGVKPIFTIITYSHGGNVLLHFAENEQSKNLTI